MRESLFEKLKKRELNYLDELMKIYSLLHEDYTSNDRLLMIKSSKGNML